MQQQINKKLNKHIWDQLHADFRDQCSDNDYHNFCSVFIPLFNDQLSHLDAQINDQIEGFQHF